MKKVVGFIKSNLRQIFETIGLIGAIALPWGVDLQELFRKYLENNTLTPDNMWWYIALTYGKPIASLVLFVAILIIFRKLNAEYVMNRRFIYHDYSYAWYWFCSKVLGIKKCNLILVPIHMQFKLAIRGTFDDYPLQDDDYPLLENESECSISKVHKDRNNRTINLILEDTFSIEDQQVDKQNRDIFTIKVSRNDGSNSRHFSQRFIDATINALKEYKQISILNVYATTNPKNTLHIARRVFGSVERGNVGHLYVFQQNKDEIRSFERKGHKIF